MQPVVIADSTNQRVGGVGVAGGGWGGGGRGKLTRFGRTVLSIIFWGIRPVSSEPVWPSGKALGW